jgi:peptide deformylase
MSLRKILTYPDPILNKKAEPVSEFDRELAVLVRDMAETMYAAPGVGLAAPQVGVSKRLFVIDVRESDPTGQPVLRVFVNPEILEKRNDIVWEEGCLSLPNVKEDVERAEIVRVRALDEKGEPFELTAEGMLAVAIQHENDHLDGILIFDHLSSLKRRFAVRRYFRDQERDLHKPSARL